MLVYYFVLFIVSNRYLLFWVSNGHNSVTVQNRTHVYLNIFYHKDLGNHLLQLCPKVVKHPVYIYRMFVAVGEKRNGREEGAISYGQSQWSFGTCNNVLPVFVVSATSLGLLGRPNLLYQIFSCGGSWKTVCSGGVSWLFKNPNKPLLTKLRLLMRTYGGACAATSRHACNNALI